MKHQMMVEAEKLEDQPTPAIPSSGRLHEKKGLGPQDVAGLDHLGDLRLGQLHALFLRPSESECDLASRILHLALSAGEPSQGGIHWMPRLR